MSQHSGKHKKEEEKAELIKQFSKAENSSKQITGLELQNSHHFVPNQESQEGKPQNIENLEKQKQIQHSADLQEQSNSTPNKEDKIKTNDNSENSPLWSMSFDGSCNKTSAGAGVWIHNTKNNHAKGHSYKLNLSMHQ